MVLNVPDYERIIAVLLKRIEDLEGKIQNTSNTQRFQREISKLKMFMDVFNRLTGVKKLDVKEEDLIAALTGTTYFSSDDAVNYLRTAEQNGQIYERREGYYAKA